MYPWSNFESAGGWLYAFHLKRKAFVINKKAANFMEKSFVGQSEFG
jgi:hypothetical protein